MIELDDITRKRLRFIQKSNRDKRVYIKVTVLLMLNQGYSPADIAETLGLDDSTVYRYKAAFIESDLDSYLGTNYFAYQGKLAVEQEGLLKEELQNFLYISSREVTEFIEKTFRIRYTTDGVVKLLRRLGFVYKKTRLVPSRADAQKQAEFVVELQERLQNINKHEVVYFNDAVHPQHNTRADYGWILKGESIEIPSNPGRKKLNLNGALNATDVTDILIREDETINAQSTIRLWKSQRKRHPDKIIYNICDNARYYHCHIIREWLEKNNWCKVIYLPPYSPNLNLIERLWKYLRKQVISYHYYEHFEDFRHAVLSFFKTIKRHKHELQSLLTLNFQIISA